ncbi:unnamed protein product [Gadus morhua 'NCC']
MAAVPPSTACASEDPRATLRSDFQPGLAPREQRHPANARGLPHTNLPTARCGAFWDVCRSEEVKAVAYRSGDNQFIFSSDIIPLYALHFPHGASTPTVSCSTPTPPVLQHPGPQPSYSSHEPTPLMLHP